MTEPTPAAAPTGAPARRRRWLGFAVAGAVVAAVVAAGLGYALTRDAGPGFESPEAIAALLEERGAPCTDFEAGGDGRAEERGTCRADGQEIVIATFGSRAEVEAHWQRQIAAAADNDAVGMVIGDRWSISGAARAYLRHAAEVLDAEYRAN